MKAKLDIEKRYCQSCGMPIPEFTDLFQGTNEDKSRNKDFCFYCLKDGKYTVNFSMKQVVEEWVKYTHRYNNYAGTNYTPEELRIVLSKRLPQLKRWSQKTETHSVNNQVIYKVCSYIDKHLFEDITIENLLEVSNISKFHLRRIFKYIKGENIGNYVQRLRLEYIAHLLLNTDKTLDEIVKKTNYQTKASLAKAFRKHFGLSTSDYKKKYKETISVSKREQELGLIPEIKKVQEITTLCRILEDNWQTLEDYTHVWNELQTFIRVHDLKSDQDKFVSISLDDPLITPREKCRFYIGITTTKKIRTEGKFSYVQIPEGVYAVFRFKGNYVLLRKFYREVYENWLLQHGYRQLGTMSFEMYMNTPHEVGDEELITDVYFPIEKQD